MMNYLHPLNERVRLMLRFEALFKYITSAQKSPTFDEPLAYLALESLVYLVNLSGRYDINAEFVKELERLNTVLCQQELIDLLKGFYDKSSQNLRQNEFLNSLKQKIAISGPTYYIDYHRLRCWLARGSKMRQHDFDYWVEVLSPYIVANEAIIKRYHDISVMQSLRIEKGFCQFSLPKNTCLLGVYTEYQDFYPEFSGNQYRMTIRLLNDGVSYERPRQSTFSGNMDLMVCVV